MATCERRMRRDRHVVAAFMRGVPAREIARRRKKSRRWVYQRIRAMGWTVSELRRKGARLLAREARRAQGREEAVGEVGMV